jgi:hypothetical protein
MERGPSRLLIASRDLATLRGHYEDVIVALVQAGVQVSIRYANDEGLSAERYRGTLLRRGCAVELSSLARGERGRGDLLALRLRQLANLLRFAHPDYRGREWLREAKFGKAAPGPRRWAGRLGPLGSRIALLGVRLAASVDRVLPPPQAARAMLAAERPDAVAVVGVVWSPGLVDVLKAAALERIPSATWVQSWDNLTNKGLLHFTPDRVFVWNDVQRAELARYHGIPERHACVTGAQTFDHWFNGDTPSSRAEFCSQDGLDPERPIILYLASSRQIEPPPADFFLRWLEAIRSSGDPVLEGATVLVRPHPTSLQPWLGLDRRHPRLSVSPSVAAAPINSAEYRQRFRDELHHASVAVGLNTSGMIDAAILGKPVCTVELPDVPNRQRGTIHFEYLVSVGGGFVQTATSLEEHVTAIAELVRRDPYERDERSARFMREFIRPHGIGVAPASVFSEEMLQLLQGPSELRLPNRLGRTIGRLIHQAAPLLGAPLEEKPPLRRWWRRHGRKPLKKLMKPVKRLMKPVKRLMKHRVRPRARLKPIRWFFRVWLRAAIRARLQRLPLRSKAVTNRTPPTSGGQP